MIIPPGHLIQSNKPDPHELFQLPKAARGEDGVARKVHYIQDEKVDNCGLLKIYCEDHTVANPLRMQMLRDDEVRFVGYRVPHPLEHMFDLRVQTSSSTTPLQATRRSLRTLTQEATSLKQNFEVAARAMDANHGFWEYNVKQKKLLQEQREREAVGPPKPQARPAAGEEDTGRASPVDESMWSDAESDGSSVLA
mmetsp:Transcript_25561/g.65699  ORF Transcript_25561/g.65699 Transcript_25561/m.65699 type:complete len:195 (-) Transcript_25561:51-635(-)